MDNKILSFAIIVFLSAIYPHCVSAEKITINCQISEREFMDRNDITEAIFSSDCGVTEIPEYAFLGCTNLKKVVLPAGMKKIGFQAFCECSSLEEINFPESLEDIGSNAFAYCKSLRDPVFPSGLKHIGHNAFSFCGSLVDIFLPDSIEELESYAFSDCANLRSVRLPGNDRLLGELMMNCCPKLTEVIEPSPIVPKFDCESYIFDPDDTAAYSRCTLVVPNGSVEAYRSSPSWSLFKMTTGQ